MDESINPWYPPTRLNWIKTHACASVQIKQKIPSPNVISPMRMMKIMVDYLFELQLLRDINGLFSSEDLQKINDLIDFVSHISVSTRIELISLSESSVNPIVTYYKKYFMPLHTLIDSQCYKMELRHSQLKMEEKSKNIRMLPK